jgi:hypothetical protein
MHQSIAMWSGPRNISTAMMRSWGNRPDTVVCDEPLYAHYLLVTGHSDHPGYTEIVRHHETDWRKVVASLTGPVAEGKTVFYQKHMAHHLLPGMPQEWIGNLTNCFLIRDPKEMLLSLIEFLPSPCVEETGLPQQVQLFERVAEASGEPPPVLDARDVLTDPAGMLEALCQRVQIRYEPAMLSWPLGPRETDGAWARHWYSKVYATTSFAPYRPRDGFLPDHLQPVLEQCQSLYEQLHVHRLKPAPRATTHAAAV